MDGIATQSPSSLHRKVMGDLLARIQNGQFPPGAVLPTEAALCREYGVSRITVRRAMAELVTRRLVTRRRGVGSFVTGRQAEAREFHLVGFLDETMRFNHRIVRNAVERADGPVAAALGVAPGSPVRRIRTVVHRDDEPFTVADAYTADLPGARVSEADVVSHVPVAQRLSQRLGRRIARAEQELDALPADAAAARLLGIAARTPVIRARRLYYAADDTPIQYLVVRYHPKRYRFVVDLVPRTDTTAFEALSNATAFEALSNATAFEARSNATAFEAVPRMPRTTKQEDAP
jgi:GntR family transcriptional regulator